MMMPSTPWMMAASTSAVCFGVLFSPSVSMSVMPPIASASSRSSFCMCTKNGNSSAGSDQAMVRSSWAWTGAAANEAVSTSDAPSPTESFFFTSLLLQTRTDFRRSTTRHQRMHTAPLQRKAVPAHATRPEVFLILILMSTVSSASDYVRVGRPATWSPSDPWRRGRRSRRAHGVGAGSRERSGARGGTKDGLGPGPRGGRRRAKGPGIRGRARGSGTSRTRSGRSARDATRSGADRHLMRSLMTGSGTGRHGSPDPSDMPLTGTSRRRDRDQVGRHRRPPCDSRRGPFRRPRARAADRACQAHPAVGTRRSLCAW